MVLKRIRNVLIYPERMYRFELEKKMENKTYKRRLQQTWNILHVKVVCMYMSYSLTGSSFFSISSDAGTDASIGVSL